MNGQLIAAFQPCLSLRMKAALSIAASLFGSTVEGEHLLKLGSPEALADSMRVASSSTLSALAIADLTDA